MKRLLVLLSISMVLPAFGQPTPKISNAQVQTSSASAGLEKTVRSLIGRSTGTVWIGYAVPTQTSSRFVCCCGNFRGYDDRGGCSGGCKLDDEHGSYYSSSNSGSDDLTCASAASPTHIFVFLRTQGGKITRVRPFSQNCALDAKNVGVHWLTDVREQESIDLLVSLARKADDLGSFRSDGGALDAIALHDGPAADAALESFLVPNTPSHLREQAAFWVAVERGHHGFEVLQRYIRNDSDEGFRKQLTFAISQNSDPQSVPELLRSAHQDSSSQVRGQALFWLAQKAGSKVSKEIGDVIDNDPDTDVKKKAVFALTQMPNDEGVTKLIVVASKNHNPIVRKEAVFWLGQSGDPRALSYIEQILLK
jgi:hypothetical protein